MMHFTSQEVDTFRQWGNTVQDTSTLTQEDALLLVKVHRLLCQRCSHELLKAAGISPEQNQLYC